MMPSFASEIWFRSPLVVLSDRRPAPGTPRTGLESAIEWAVREHDGLWLVRHGAAGAPLEAEAGARARERWSVLGDAPGDAPPLRPAADGFSGYVRANAAYAERIIESVRAQGMVWINGHRWLLVPAALREHGHRGPIGLLLDVPLPPRARLEALPWSGEVLAALSQLDVLGLRTPACVDCFEACLARAGGRRPWLGVVPSGAEPAGRAEPPAWVTSFLHLLGAAAGPAAARAV
ncbi:MAG TPA: trehalose-6-phosphate synthase [Kofleriaceae bacterium]|nr:trehalose-6-phosphate synthase [Kofleriaceae bacterium]